MMLRRILSRSLYLLALVAVIWDIKQSIDAHPGFVISSLGELWALAHPLSLAAARDAVTAHAPPVVWEKGIQTLLDLPAWLLLAVLGVAIGAIGRRGRRAPIAAAVSGADGSPAARRQAAPPSGRTELSAALRSCRGALLGVALFSGFSSVLMLTGSFYMLEIYDRVLPSRSVPTLVGLTILAGVLFAAQALLDVFRGRLLVRIGAALDATLSQRVYEMMVRLPLRFGSRADNVHPLRDLDAIRSFLSGLGPTALFDLPWIPVYLGIVFAFHTWLGVTALIGAIILISLTLATEIMTRKPTVAAMNHGLSRNGLTEASRRNAEVLTAMGFTSRMGRLWSESNRQTTAAQQEAGDVAGGFGAISRVLRMVLQAAVLGIGAYLVIQQEASAGIIIAGAILAARAFAPVDLAIAHWRGFVAARISWPRLSEALARMPTTQAPMPLPAPQSNLTVENLSAAPPGEPTLILHDVSFRLNRGQGLGIIGPSGAGKTSLARTLVGAWLPARGTIRLDGASFDQWAPEPLGRQIGYLPQDVELFAGSIGENICRFEMNADPEAIIEAARAADVHELVVSLPHGYETQIGEQGATISAGQRQRVGLARALYGDPFLVVLDEPDASLDGNGELALRRAIQGVRARGGIVIVITHRQSVLTCVDLLLALQAGRPLAFGPREQVLHKLVRPVPTAVELPAVPPDLAKAKA